MTLPRPTQSYSAVPPFGAPIEELANPEEAAAREQLVVDVIDDAGVWLGRAVWRGEIGQWTGHDATHRLPFRRGTIKRVRSLLEKRAALKREEVKR